jgi:[ribosomal protein S5]-alanine N-acetyltransferase
MAERRRQGAGRVAHARPAGDQVGRRERLTEAPRAIHRPERLDGDGCVLRALRRSDVASFVDAFREDPELGWLLGFEHDPTTDYVEERLRSERSRLRNGRSVSFAIADPDDDSFLGEVLLHSFDWQHQRAALGVWVAAAERGRGLGVCALRAVCQWGFEELALARIEATTFPDNDGMLRIAEQAGFTHEGVLRSYTRERGRRCDVAMVSLLPGELK